MRLAFRSDRNEPNVSSSVICFDLQLLQPAGDIGSCPRFDFDTNTRPSANITTVSGTVQTSPFSMRNTMVPHPFDKQIFGFTTFRFRCPRVHLFNAAARVGWSEPSAATHTHRRFPSPEITITCWVGSTITGFPAGRFACFVMFAILPEMCLARPAALPPSTIAPFGIRVFEPCGAGTPMTRRSTTVMPSPHSRRLRSGRRRSGWRRTG